MVPVAVHGASTNTADTVPGANGQPQANWGLHLIDANLGMGNLIEIVVNVACANSTEVVRGEQLRRTRTLYALQSLVGDGVSFA